MHCLDCGDVTDLLKSKLMELKEAETFFDAAQVCLEQNNPEGALDKAKQCLQIRKNLLYKHHEDIAMTLDLMAKVYTIMG